MDKEDGRCNIYKLPISSMDLGYLGHVLNGSMLCALETKTKRDAGEKVIRR